MEEENKALSLIEKMKAKAKARDACSFQITEAKMNVAACPNCGAGRASGDGLTKCAYCGFEFLSVQLTDGVSLKKEDNSA